MEQDLTDKQRRILLLMVFHEVPMDEVVQQLDTNRNAIYKSLHDARRKLKVDCRHVALKSVRCYLCLVPSRKILASFATNDVGKVMKPRRFDRLLRNIYETWDVEISCTECFDLVSRFVELEISGVMWQPNFRR